MIISTHNPANEPVDKLISEHLFFIIVGQLDPAIISPRISATWRIAYKHTSADKYISNWVDKHTKVILYIKNDTTTVCNVYIYNCYWSRQQTSVPALFSMSGPTGLMRMESSLCKAINPSMSLAFHSSMELLNRSAIPSSSSKIYPDLCTKLVCANNYSFCKYKYKRYIVCNKKDIWDSWGPW